MSQRWTTASKMCIAYFHLAPSRTASVPSCSAGQPPPKGFRRSSASGGATIRRFTEGSSSLEKATIDAWNLIHSHQNSDYWVMVSAAEGEDIGHFPTLRAALNFINPVTLPARTGELSGDDNASNVSTEKAIRDAQAMIMHLQGRLDASAQRLQAAQAELAAERQARQRAEQTARAVLHAVNEWKSRRA